MDPQKQQKNAKPVAPLTVSILLSMLVLPGLGQFLQRRWVAGLFYLATTGISAAYMLLGVWRAVTTTLETIAGVAEMDPAGPLGALFSASVLVPTMAFLTFYVLNIIDVQYADQRRRRREAEDAFARRVGFPPSAVGLLVLALVVPVLGDPIHDAVRRGDVLAVSAVLERDRSAVNAVLGTGVTPLHLAAALNNPTVVAILVSAGADIEARTADGFTPLHWAASRDAYVAADLLLRLGADVNGASPHGITPLHWAAGKNATRTLKLLVNRGARVDSMTETGLSPLHWAVRVSAEDAATILAYKAVTDAMEQETEEAAPAAETPAQSVPNTTPEPPPPSEPEITASPEPTPPAVTTPVARAVPGETLVVPLGFGHDMKFVWIKSLGIWVGKFEVSNGEFRRFRPDHNSLFRETYSLNEDSQPAVYVSWDDAVAFCAWLNKSFANRLPAKCLFRLPSSAEWMTVARCGDDRTYPWGQKLPPRYGNYSDLTARQAFTEWSGIKHYDDGFAVSCPVGESGSNEWEIFGLAGNVWEWCLDWYDDEKRYKVRHGASWDFDTEVFLPVDVRGFDRPDARYDTVGFRVVVSGPAE